MSNPFGSGQKNLSVKERFDGKYIPEPNSGCWLWTGGCYPNGYGSITTKKQAKGAHRVAWEIYRGSIPSGLCVLHKCDLKLCVNPAHLFLGDARDNRRDCARKKRCNQSGEQNNNAKLTIAHVSYLRSLEECPTTTLKTLAEQWQVSWLTLRYVREGWNWGGKHRTKKGRDHA